MMSAAAVSSGHTSYLLYRSIGLAVKCRPVLSAAAAAGVSYPSCSLCLASHQLSITALHQPQGCLQSCLAPSSRPQHADGSCPSMQLAHCTVYLYIIQVQSKHCPLGSFHLWACYSHQQTSGGMAQAGNWVVPIRQLGTCKEETQQFG